MAVRTYGQYCPIARASEILAMRWTPIIVRNLLQGPRRLVRMLSTLGRSRFADVEAPASASASARL